MIAPDIGAVIGGLRIDAVAGRGGMGVVYKAHQLALDRTVAMKIVNPEFADDPEFRERFRREARIAASLDHPHVVPVYHAGEDDGNVYLTMRFVEGTDLASMIAGRGRVEPRDAVEMVAQIADALDAAHARGLVHRDVKPANILLTRPGGRWHAYLTDFGISKDGRDAGMTKSGFVVGSLSYISPEQLQGEDVDGRADQYSLACVLFQALTGEVPFPRDTTAARMFAHLSAPAPALGEINPALRGPLEPVLAKGLAKRPADRYATAGEFGRAALAAVSQMDALRAAPQPFPPPEFHQHVPFADGSGSQPGRSGPQLFHGATFGPQASAPPPTHRRRGLIIGAVAAAVAVVLLVVGAIVVVPALTRPDEPAPLPPTGRLDPPIAAGTGATMLAEGAGFLWTGNRDEGSISKIDPRTGSKQDFPVPGVPGALVYGQGRVWVWNYSSTILPVDADTGVAAAYIPMGADLSAIAAGSTAVWATQPTKNVVVRLDLASAKLIDPPIAVGARPDSIAIGDGKVYVLNKADRTITTLDEATGTTLGAPVSVPDGTTQVTVESGHVFIGGSKGYALLSAGPSGLQGVDQAQLVDLNCSCGFFGGRESTWVFDDDTGTLRRFSLDLRTVLGAPLTGLGNGIGGVVAVGDKLWFLNQVQAKIYPVAVNGPI